MVFDSVQIMTILSPSRFPLLAKNFLFLVLLALTSECFAGSGSMCFGRAEDDGVINVRPAHIRVDGHQVFSLLGGEHGCVEAAIGRHIVDVYSSDPYDPGASNENAWRSKSVEITVHQSRKVGFVVKPVSHGDTYTGPWSIERMKERK